MIIRECTTADLDSAAKIRRRAFGAPPWPEPGWPGEPGAWRGWIADLHGQPCGFLRIYACGQFFGGRAVPMGGVASVAVDPPARGQGIASALLTTAIAEMRADGQCLSALFAATPALYRASGWEQTGLAEWFDLQVEAFSAVAPPARPLRLRPLGPDDLATARELYRSVAATVDGALDRDGPAFPLTDLLDYDFGYLALSSDGEPAGYLAANRPPGDRLLVEELVATGPAALATLARSIGSWAGQLNAVGLRILDPAITGLLPLAAQHRSRAQPWMLRVIDFPAAVAARGWPAAVSLRPGTVDLEIIDEQASWHSGRHRLVIDDGAQGGVHCEPGGTGAVRVRARALGPWYAGAANTAALRRAGLLDGDRDQAALLDVLVGAGNTGTPRMADKF